MEGLEEGFGAMCWALRVYARGGEIKGVCALLLQHGIMGLVPVFPGVQSITGCVCLRTIVISLQLKHLCTSQASQVMLVKPKSRQSENKLRPFDPDQPFVFDFSS